MKKLLLYILFLGLSFTAKSQFPISQSQGSPSTQVFSRGSYGSDSGFVFRTNYSDTSVLNLGFLDNIPGIQVRVGNRTYIRSQAANQWIGQATTQDIIAITGCYTLLNGGIVTWSGSGYVMDVSSAKYVIGCNFYQSPTSQVTLAASDPTLNRIDVIYVNTSGQVGVLTGTPNATPTKPQVNVSTQLELTFITVDAASTSPGGVTQTIVYDENLGSPTEWVASSVLPSGSINYNSTNNPFHLTKNGLLASGSDGALTFTSGVPVNVSNYSVLKLYIRNDAALVDNYDIGVILSLGGLSPAASLSLADYGYSPAVVGSYQVITIPLADFVWGLPTLDGIVFKINTTTTTIHFDYIQLQGGIPTGNSPYITDVFRRTGTDSVFQVRNGIAYFAFRDSLGGAGVNIYNSDGTLIDDRFLDGDGYTLYLSNLNHLDVDSYIDINGMYVGGLSSAYANVFIGHNSSLNKTNIVNSIAIGNFALRNATTGSQNNVGIGSYALNALTNGVENIGIGSSAVQLLTTGDYNIAIGRDAMYSMTTGNNSTAIGQEAMRNSTGSNNTAVGYHAMTGAISSTAVLNSAFGLNSMYSVSSGSQNTAYGAQSLYSLTTGDKNVAVGAGALELTTTGGFNIAMGVDALLNNTTGIRNIGIGWNAKFGNTSSQNIGIGYQAGSTVSSGSDNIFIGGFQTGFNALQKVDAVNSVAIGSGAYTTKDSQFVVGNPAMKELLVYASDSAMIKGLKRSTSSSWVMAIDSATKNMTFLPSSAISGSTPTWQQTLTTGSTLTGSNTIAGGGFNFIWNNMGSVEFNMNNTDFTVQDADDINLIAPNDDNNKGIYMQGGYLQQEIHAGTSNYGYTNIARERGFREVLYRGTGSAGIRVDTTTKEVAATRTNELTLFSSISNNDTAYRFIKLNAGATRFGGIETAPGVYNLRINANGDISRADTTTGGGGSTALSALTAATGTNTINNVANQQEWQWNSLAGGTGLYLSASTTAATGNSQALFSSILSGANSNSTQTTYSVLIGNNHTGTASTNIGVFSAAENGTTNIGAQFRGAGGTNNYALIVGSGDGSVGIGTSTPTSLLHVNGVAQFGTAGSTLGQILMSGNTSGTVTIQPAAAAGTPTLTLPTVTGTIVAYVEATTASSATPSPQGSAKENYYDITALATNATVAAPSGTPANHNTLVLRISSDATPRTLSWNAIYRASSDLALPSITVASKTMYVGFIYNSLSSTWDLVSVLDNF